MYHWWKNGDRNIYVNTIKVYEESLRIHVHVQIDKDICICNRCCGLFIIFNAHLLFTFYNGHGDYDDGDDDDDDDDTDDGNNPHN